MKDGAYELLSAEEMRKRYGLTAETRPALRLDPQKVPQGLRPLIAWAELWGIGDDLIREDMVRRAPKQAIEDLKEIVRRHDDLLDQWLAGPETNNPRPSAEYLAFSAMRMAADFA